MSGVNFSVGNQLATPSIHAAPLANRPAAGQPGRVFIDSDNPSTGIYRDTGTAWVQIAANGGGGGTLQTVTTAGNTTNLNLVLTYEDSTVSNALVFYNEDQAQEEYVVLKRQTGITTNDCLVIQSRGNISPSTNPAGIMIDGANDVIKTFYGTAYTEIGLKLDFANLNYYLGDYNGVNNGTLLSIDDFNQNIIFESLNVIKSTSGGNDIGLKLDFANIKYYLGDYNNINNGVYFLADNDNGFACIYQQGYLSFRADGAEVRIGDLSGTSNFTYFGVSDTNEELIGSTGLLSNTAGGNSGQHLKIRIGSTLYKIALLNP